MLQKVIFFLPCGSIMKLIFCQIFFSYRGIKYIAGKIQIAHCHMVIMNCVILKSHSLDRYLPFVCLFVYVFVEQEIEIKWKRLSWKTEIKN